MLRVRLVGELGLEADGRPCEPPAPTKARALLAWLALHPGPRSRSEVMTTPAGRAVTQYGFVDEFLGRLGPMLGRPEARAQIEGALARYERHGWRPFAERARAMLARTSRVVG
jgi:hypothetical protein